MHISFITYGERTGVERMLREMEAQKHLMPMTKGNKKKGVWIPGQVRELPFGVREYICPKESMDMVLRTLEASGHGDYGIKFKKIIYPLIRKFLKLKSIPKYEEEGDKYLWTNNFVSTVVLGIREDGEIVGLYVDDKGWTHERL